MNRAVAACLLALACMPGARRPAPLPASLPPAPWTLPSPQVATLSNGMPLWVVTLPGSPVFRASFSIRAGSPEDPVGREGLWLLTALIRMRQTDTRDETALNEAITAAGGEVAYSIADDSTGLSVVGSVGQRDALLGLFGELVRATRVDPQTFDVAKAQVAAWIRGTLTDPAQVGESVANHAFWGDAHIGRTPTEASITAITPDEVAAFQARWWGPANGMALVIGPWEVAEAKAAVDGVLAGFTNEVSRAPAAPPVASAPEQILLVDLPGAAQSELYMIRPFPGQDAADYPAAVLGSLVLGGDFTSRVNLHLREKEGWTYGAYCTPWGWDAVSALRCDALVNAEATVPALAALRQELEGMRTAPPTDAEIDDMRRIWRSQLRLFYDFSSMEAAVLGNWRHERPPDALARLVAQTDAVPASAVRDSATRWADPSQATWVVVGDAASLRAPLATLGIPVAEVPVPGAPAVDARP